MEILSAEQTRAWDAYTILHEPIASLALMDRAVEAFSRWFERQFPDVGRPVCVCCGTGNNGGDGIGIALQLFRSGRPVQIWAFRYSGRHSADFDAQWARLPKHGNLSVSVFHNVPASLPELPADAILIDALFGTGLSRPLEGAWADTVALLNQIPCEKIAVDLPSGLLADRHTPGNAVVRADRTFSFERPKLAFFFAENADRVGEWEFGSIGLHPGFLAETSTETYLLDDEEVQKRYRARPKHAHKGTFGHALLIAGSYGKMGAAVLAARACLRSGAGLLSVHAPRCGNIVLQTAVPEAMYLPDRRAKQWSSLPETDLYQSIGIGPGIGKAPETAAALEYLLRRPHLPPLVLDADALNLLAENPDWWAYVPPGTVLTPHPKEFERLFGPSTDDFARNALARAKAKELRVHIVLKGAHTAIACPDGTCWFNNNGNPGMATGGSGDVLTGVIYGAFWRRVIRRKMLASWACLCTGGRETGLLPCTGRLGWWLGIWWR
jgi:yjeF C-terminal region, hydroxyethylthiazole kinase-related/yjeF N-terminal region